MVISEIIQKHISVKNCENLDRRNGHGKLLIWSWNFISKVSWEPWFTCTNRVNVVPLRVKFIPINKIQIDSLDSLLTRSTTDI